MTRRIVTAIENPCVNIIGHPTGRLIGEREPYDIDMERVISAAHDLGSYLEINAEPDRLDLNDTHAHAAKSKGVKVTRHDFVEPRGPKLFARRIDRFGNTVGIDHHHITRKQLSASFAAIAWRSVRPNSAPRLRTRRERCSAPNALR